MHLALLAPGTPDASTGYNSPALTGAFLRVHPVPRATRGALMAGEEVGELLSVCLA